MNCWFNPLSNTNSNSEPSTNPQPQLEGYPLTGVCALGVGGKYGGSVVYIFYHFPSNLLSSYPMTQFSGEALNRISDFALAVEDAANKYMVTVESAILVDKETTAMASLSVFSDGKALIRIGE